MLADFRSVFFFFFNLFCITPNHGLIDFGCVEVLWKSKFYLQTNRCHSSYDCSWLTAKAVKPFPTMYCNEIKQKYLSTPKKLMQMLGPADNISADEAFRTYVRPIWDAGNLPFTDSWQWRGLRLKPYCCSYCFLSSLFPRWLLL